MSLIGNWSIHFMNSRGELTPYQLRIEEALWEVWNRSRTCIPAIHLDVEVVAVINGGIPETGHSGYAPWPGLIRLTIDPTNKNMSQNMGEPLERVIAHELHHALRWDSVGYGTTLIEALVSEGLSGRFVEELYQNKPEPWECALTDLELKLISSKALVQSDDKKYDHSRWFFGSKDLPKWGGYTLGFELVGLAMMNSKRLPSEMIDMPASDYIHTLEALAAGELS